MRSKILQILLYISIVFLIIFLYIHGIMFIPKINKPWLFILSVILFCVGFLIDTKAWQLILHNILPKITYKDAFISSGKYIFSKYIPGKVWIIFGKAGYLNVKYSVSLVTLSSIAIYYQIISLIAATLIGLGILYYLDITVFIYALVCSNVLIIFFIFFNEWILEKCSKVFTWILRRKIVLPVLSEKMTLRVFSLSLLMWLIFSLSFYIFLFAVINEIEFPVIAGMIFPISSVFGIIVLIAPGGLGIREGFMVFALSLFGVPTVQAGSAAILSRVWTLFSELLFFIMALFQSLNKPNKDNFVIFKF